MTISNTDDVIDSRDVIERIEELQGERDSFELDGEENPEAWAEQNPDDAEELRELEALAEECEGYASDWRHGEALIRESYWEDYVQELLEDCGDIPRNLPHYLVIDWEATARNIAVDYTEVDFGGVTYYIRSC